MLPERRRPLVWRAEVPGAWQRARDDNPDNPEYLLGAQREYLNRTGEDMPPPVAGYGREAFSWARADLPLGTREGPVAIGGA